MRRTGVPAGCQILVGATVFAVISLVVVTASVEGVDFDENADYLINEGMQVPEEQQQHLWEEELQVPESGELLTQIRASPKGASSDADPLDGQEKDAVAAVAVAQKLLEADEGKAAALINKAEASGKVADQKSAAAAVNEARRLGSNLKVAERSLSSVKKQIKTLPVSEAARTNENKQKAEQAEQKRKAAQEKKALQEEYKKQYGVKSQCSRQCTNKKTCENETCQPKQRQLCVKNGPEKCFWTKKCAKKSKQCAKVQQCLQKGPLQCEYPRTCVKQEDVCQVKNVCIEEKKNCDQGFSSSCVACAKQVEVCQDARKTAATCGPACKSHCGAHDEACLSNCNVGCQEIYDKSLTACKKKCPQCDPEKVCTTTCLKQAPQKVCSKECMQWQVAGNKTCHLPCLKMGKVTQCNDAFCTEYIQDKKVCDKACLQDGSQPAGKDCKCREWSPMDTQVCEDKCEHKKCVPSCSPTFHKECKLRGPMRCHRPKTCAVKTQRKCFMMRGCAQYGAKTCKNKTKCLAYENRCSVETRCAEHETSCAKDYSADCVACAAQSQACLAARKSSETCMNCQKECEGDEQCLRNCKKGCETIQAGLLSSCRAVCPQCKKKVETCQTTCKKSKAVNVCKKTCTKEIETSEKFCFKPCLKYGKYEHCEDDYCPKSTYGKRVCDKPCVRYEATATKWCQPKCEAVQCKELCTYKPKETCTKYAEECKAEQCLRRGKKCAEVDKCLIPGKKSCIDPPQQCLNSTQVCSNATVCVHNSTHCSADTTACDTCKAATAACTQVETGQCKASCKVKCATDAACLKDCTSACTSFDVGFSSACKAACPMCGVPAQVCKEQCSQTEVKQTCTSKCTKSVLLGTRQCTHGPCLAMGRTSACDEDSCLDPSVGPNVCKKKCVESTVQLEKVCGTDCSADPAASYDEYVKLKNTTAAREKHVDTCESECYATKQTCHGDEVHSCTRSFQQQVLSCVAACNAPAAQPEDTYGVCMDKCETVYPLAGIMSCRNSTCASMDAQELENCKGQCYEPRGRCRCACDTDKEYVCKGYDCKCRTNDSGGFGGNARAVAQAVAGAAQNTADVITKEPPSKNINEAIGAQSAAAAAANEAEKYGGAGQTDAEIDAALHESAIQKAKEQELAAIAEADKMKRQMQQLMTAGAFKEAVRTAKHTTTADSVTQQSETLVAATTGAKQSSTKLVRSVVKSLAHAATKVAMEQALVHKKANATASADVSAAVKEAVRAAIDPISSLIDAVAKNATEVAIELYPSFDTSTGSELSDEAVADIRESATSGAESEAELKATKMDKRSLLKDVKAAARKVANPKVLSYVKHLAAKAAVHSRARSLDKNATMQVAMDAAKLAAEHVSQKALNTSADIIDTAAEEAVEKAITDAAAARMGSDGETTTHTIASDVKDALDKADTTGQDSKQSAKEAVLKAVHRASSAASKEAAEKGESKESQAKAADKAAKATLQRGRTVQRVVDNIPNVDVKVTPAEDPAPASTKVNSTTLVEVLHEADDAASPDATKDKAPSNGDLVLETIEKRGQVSHLQHRLETAAQTAAETAAQEAATRGSSEALTAARKAARLATKSAVLSEVQEAATIAAQHAKNALHDRDLKKQTDAASAAASQAAKRVLKIARGIVEDVAQTAARTAMNHMGEDDEKHSEEEEPTKSKDKFQDEEYLKSEEQSEQQAQESFDLINEEEGGPRSRGQAKASPGA